MKPSLCVALIFLTSIQAVKVAFKVIAPEAKSTVHVHIKGRFTQLNAQDPDVPYFTGSAEINSKENYNYVVDGVPETFERILNGLSTRNDFFDRPVTYATNIPELPSILTEGSWTRGDTDNPIWDSNYIPSIFVTGDVQQMNDLIENVTKTTFSTKITFIGPETGCTFGLHKPGRKHNDAKQSWIWALPEGQFMAHRNWFKLRHMEEDPTQQREKLYADILRKMGTYANQANMVRFFINKEGMGTFNMLDDVIMYSYINAMFYLGETPERLGGLFDGASGASFKFPGDFDSFIPNYESPIDQEGIAPFARSFNSVNFTDDEQVLAIGEYFDYDQFLRFMVMEFLTGHWDGYWHEQTNDGAYIDVNDNNKVYYLGQDFDATFGVNLLEERQFVNLSFIEYTQKFPAAILINRLLQNPTIKGTFENYINTTVQEIFNRDTLSEYLLARYEFILPDLIWDRSIQQRSPGNNFGWTIEQTYENLLEPVTAAGEETGGADWGLLEWVEAKEGAVKRFFGDQGISADQVSLAPSSDEAPLSSLVIGGPLDTVAAETPLDALVIERPQRTVEEPLDALVIERPQRTLAATKRLTTAEPYEAITEIQEDPETGVFAAAKETFESSQGKTTASRTIQLLKPTSSLPTVSIQTLNPDGTISKTTPSKEEQEILAEIDKKTVSSATKNKSFAYLEYFICLFSLSLLL